MPTEPTQDFTVRGSISDPSEVQTNVAPALFRDNILIVVGFNCWGGTATVRTGDEAIFGAENFDHKYFKKGSIVLIDAVHLEPFEKERSKLVGWLKGVGRPFFVPGMRMYKKSEAEEVFQKVRECRVRFAELAQEFLDKYEEIVEARIRVFDQDHPENTGRLNKYFPALGKLQNSFGVHCVPVSISDVDGLEQVCADEKDSFRTHVRSLVGDMAAEFRQTIVEAATAFKTGITKAAESESGDMNSRTVTAFRNFLNKVEKHDFLNDKQMQEMIRKMRFGMENVQNWNVKEEPSIRELIGTQLDEVITTAQDEASTAAVVSSLNIYEPAPVVIGGGQIDESGGLGSFGSSSEEVVIAQD